MTARDGIVYGVGALRAAARGDRMMWALHRAALTYGIVPVVTVGAVAEAYRTEARGDRLDALLAGTEVEPLGREGAQRTGELASRAGTADLVAVSTAETAARRNAAIVNTRQAALRAATTVLGHDLVQYGV
ncbi:MAG TPA: hypothetical protein VMD28_00630 [Acidimicrobiales bacterium]|nr:hypothetical protein [Acidimicrobiales bacterium]